MEFHPSRLSLHIKFCHYCRHGADWTETKTKIDYTLWNIHRGGLSMEIGGRTLTASQGDVLLFHPGDTYTASCIGECCDFLVTFFTLDLGNSLDIFKRCNSAGIYGSEKVRDASRKLCGAFLEIGPDACALSLELYALFLTFLSKFLPCLGTQERFYERPASPPPLKINRLFTYLEENVEKNISVGEMASFMGMSEKYFIQYFHSHTGYSPKQYLINLRMSHSARLLSDADLTLSQIALRLDFSDQYAFSKAFKKYYGEAPGTFRKHFF